MGRMYYVDTLHNSQYLWLESTDWSQLESTGVNWIKGLNQRNNMSGPEKSDGKALGRQVGGSHYQTFAIQPVTFIVKNNCSWIQGNVIKRIMRFNQEGGGGLKDLEKIKHEIDLFIEESGIKDG